MCSVKCLHVGQYILLLSLFYMLFTAALGLSHNLITDPYVFYNLLGSVYSTLIYYYFHMPFTVPLGLSIALNINYLLIKY